MSEIYFQHAVCPNGVRLERIEEKWFKKRVVPLSAWSEHPPASQLAVLDWIQARLDEENPHVVRLEGEEAIILDHGVVASLHAGHAKALGLPDPVPHILHLESRGAITDAAFRIDCVWMDRGRELHGCQRQGSILAEGTSQWRIPQPLFDVVEAVEPFRRGETQDDPIRFAQLARIKDVLQNALADAAAGKKIGMDRHFRSIRMAHASAFSLRLQDGKDGITFDPILFTRRLRESSEDGDGEIAEAEGLLAEADQKTFIDQRFSANPECRDRYALGDGSYVFIDPDCREALTVVRRMQQADPETRRQFARNPRPYLKEHLGDFWSESSIESLFIETEEFSERVTGIGEWKQEKMPLLERVPETWLPERFGISLGGREVVLGRDELPELTQRVEEAVTAGQATVPWHGDDVPATAEVLDKLHTLVRQPPPADTTKPGSELDGEKQKKYFAETLKNLEVVTYRRERFSRDSGSLSDIALLGDVVRTTLKPHQQEGFLWMCRSWRFGLPGLLLADDMGLGKTLQALAFLAWLRRSGEKRPFLVVAPTGLLVNWQEEARRHVQEGFLEPFCRVYGTHLRELKEIVKGTDIERGVPGLKIDTIKGASLVLTSYETLRDYHISFLSIPFAVAVFDEAQKIKNSRCQLAVAATSIKADMMLTMTGTPVENQLADLWSIMDLSASGLLGDLKSFAQEYRADDHASLQRLHQKLTREENGRPPYMLRRMKHDHLPGLPEKKPHSLSETMPPKQAEKYQEVIQHHQHGRKGSMLETLHALRGISLHPIDPRGLPDREHDQDDSYLALSARFQVTFRVLDDIAKKKEKALIFLEDLEMQVRLAGMIKRRYALPHQPLIINGTVAGEKRQKAANEFQKPGREAFDVMILSPRAGGVGLTLTAANHVIHLSRWWNPAVEDQCTDRVYRIGQEKTVHVYHPLAIHPNKEIAPTSFDQKLDDLLRRKRELGKQMLLPPVLPGADEADLCEGVIPTNDKEGKNLLEEIDRMDHQQFERWVQGQAREAGFQVEPTGGTGDGGADAILVHPETQRSIIVQCKYRQPEAPCDAEAVEDLLRARQRYRRGDSPLLVALTNAKNFSLKARRQAERNDIRLIARADLPMWPKIIMT
ncbi:MAG: restriction endonuclease [Magnetococcales bacterium]|nr:restriction endonuclease [Magnetococcales bacterium]MBF0322063.1 restriction endonuclease [Magnetococcales bacterium]